MTHGMARRGAAAQRPLSRGRPLSVRNERKLFARWARRSLFDKLLLIMNSTLTGR
jgi:hypothetical protein